MNRPIYKDDLHAKVKSISNALYLQETYSPAPLRNLSVSVGARLELQKLYDMNGTSLPWHLVLTFNEWGEGTSVESAQEWATPSGYGAYLDALHNAP